MTADELDRIERLETRLRDKRESRRLLPIDHCSQLDTGYTGRQDNDHWDDPTYFREWISKGVKDPRRMC